jgi:hypothetical protein
MRIICLLILVTYAATGKTQEDRLQKKWVLHIRVVAGKLYNTDRNFSSQPFSGINGGGAASIIYQANNVSHEWSISFYGGNLKSSDHSMTGTQTGTGFDYINLYRMGAASGSAISVKAGPCVNVLYNKRVYDGFVNNRTSFEFASSAGAAGEVTWSGNLAANGISIADRICIPIISTLIQPAFGGEPADGYNNRTQVTSVGNFLRISNRLSVEKVIGERHAVSLHYEWDFYRIDTERVVKQANHQVAFAWHLIL